MWEGALIPTLLPEGEGLIDPGGIHGANDNEVATETTRDSAIRFYGEFAEVPANR